MSLLRNPDPRQGNAQGAGVGTLDPNAQGTGTLDPDFQGLDTYEDIIVEDARAGEFDSPNPFKRKRGSTSAMPVQQAQLQKPTNTTKQTGKTSTQPKKQAKKSSVQPKKATSEKELVVEEVVTNSQPGAAEVIDAETKAKIEEQIRKNEETSNLIGAFLASVEEDYLAQGGDPEKLEAAKAAAKEKAETELGKASGKKSKAGGNAGDAKSKSQQTDGKSSGAKAKNQADRNSEGGGKMAPRKHEWTDEEKERVRPFSAKIIKKAKPIPPSMVGPALEHARLFVEVCRKYGITLDDQLEIVNLYNGYEAIREQTNKDADRNRKEEEEFAMVFGDNV